MGYELDKMLKIADSNQFDASDPLVMKPRPDLIIPEDENQEPSVGRPGAYRPVRIDTELPPEEQRH
jgi:hypothetical protein